MKPTAFDQDDSDGTSSVPLRRNPTRSCTRPSALTMVNVTAPSLELCTLSTRCCAPPPSSPSDELAVKTCTTASHPSPIPGWAGDCSEAQGGAGAPFAGVVGEPVDDAVADPTDACGDAVAADGLPVRAVEPAGLVAVAVALRADAAGLPAGVAVAVAFGLLVSVPVRLLVEGKLAAVGLPMKTLLELPDAVALPVELLAGLPPPVGLLLPAPVEAGPPVGLTAPDARGDPKAAIGLPVDEAVLPPPVASGVPVADAAAGGSAGSTSAGAPRIWNMSPERVTV